MKPASTSFGCGDMNGGEDLPLCAPLRQLKREHGPLREAMEAFRATAERVMDDAEPARGERFRTLREQVAAFAEQLGRHAWKEDDGLFPMMARYIGKEGGPIAVMEFEHRQAELNLQQFLEAAGQGGQEMDGEEMKTIAEFAVQAHTILTQHFGKEEIVLFPMAENLLSPEEKELLHDMIRE